MQLFMALAVGTPPRSPAHFGDPFVGGLVMTRDGNSDASLCRQALQAVTNLPVKQALLPKSTKRFNFEGFGFETG